MRRRLFGALCAVSCAALVAACATSPVPKGYTGPLATVQDSALSESATRAQFFYLSHIDGRRIDNVLGQTRKTNAGRGFSMTPAQYRRDLPATASTLKLEATVDYGAPIQAMMNSSTMYTAERTITVTLESNKTYVVKGVLTADKKDVWLEELDTGKRVE